MAQGSIMPYQRESDWNQMNPEGEQPENDEEDVAFMQEPFAMKDDEAWSSDEMTAKGPPAYDGLSSFFSCEECVEE